MSNIDTIFDDLNEMVNKAFIYTPMTEEQYQASCVNDIIEWADDITNHWNGDESGSQEDQAHQADDIIQKAQELKELILGMAEL